MTRQQRKFVSGITAVFCLIVIGTALLYLAVDKREKYISSYYDGQHTYACSEPLKATKQKIASKDGHTYTGYMPLDMAKANRVCTSTAKPGDL